MIEFLDFYVAQKVPTIPPAVRLIAPAIWQSITGVGGLTLPPDRFDPSMDFDDRAAAVRVGPAGADQLGGRRRAGRRSPGAPVPTRADPLLGVAGPRREGRRRGTSSPAAGSATDARTAATPRRPDRYLSDPDARPRTSYTGAGGGIWSANPTYDWKPVVDGKSLAYITEPAAARRSRWPAPAASTSGSSTNRRDADLQVTLSEVRPDGTERYVQNGWLRLSHRKLDRARSTALAPFHTDLEEDARRDAARPSS